MIKFIENDGGRSAAGYRGYTGDCVCRAIAIVTGKPYKEIYGLIADTAAELGYPKSANMALVNRARKEQYLQSGKRGKCIDLVVLERLGFQKIKLPKGPRPTYTEAHETYGDCLATTQRHMVALKDGALQDTFDGRTYDFVSKRWGPSVNGIRVLESKHLSGERKALSVWVLPK